MHDGSVVMFNMKLDAEVLELFIIKLSVVVSDDDPREAKLRDNRLLDEFSSFDLSDLGHWLRFHPFGKVIDSH